MDLINKLKSNEASICVVGLGYVGLPLALEFAKKFNVVGYDFKADRVEMMKKNQPRFRQDCDWWKRPRRYGALLLCRCKLPLKLYFREHWAGLRKDLKHEPPRICQDVTVERRRVSVHPCRVQFGLRHRSSNQ